MLLASTGRLGHFYLNVTIVLSSRGMLYTPPHLLGLRQCIEAVDSINMLDLDFVNLIPDTYHLSLSINVLLPHVNNNLNSEFSY
jgi:hypothetical protein